MDENVHVYASERERGGKKRGEKREILCSKKATK